MTQCLQAISYIRVVRKTLSAYSRKKFDDLRQIVPMFSEDTTKYKEIQQIAYYILENKPKFPLID